MPAAQHSLKRPRTCGLVDRAPRPRRRRGRWRTLSAPAAAAPRPGRRTARWGSPWRRCGNAASGASEKRSPRAKEAEQTLQPGRKRSPAQAAHRVQGDVPQQHEQRRPISCRRRRAAEAHSAASRMAQRTARPAAHASQRRGLHTFTHARRSCDARALHSQHACAATAPCGCRRRSPRRQLRCTCSVPNQHTGVLTPRAQLCARAGRTGRAGCVNAIARSSTPPREHAAAAPLRTRSKQRAGCAQTRAAAGRAADSTDHKLMSSDSHAKRPQFS